jgi:hypothetical protein
MNKLTLLLGVLFIVFAPLFIPELLTLYAIVVVFGATIFGVGLYKYLTE